MYCGHRKPYKFTLVLRPSLRIVCSNSKRSKKGPRQACIHAISAAHTNFRRITPALPPPTRERKWRGVWLATGRRPRRATKAKKMLKATTLNVPVPAPTVESVVLRGTCHRCSAARTSPSAGNPQSTWLRGCRGSVCARAEARAGASQRARIWTRSTRQNSHKSRISHVSSIPAPRPQHRHARLQQAHPRARTGRGQRMCAMDSARRPGTRAEVHRAGELPRARCATMAQAGGTRPGRSSAPTARSDAASAPATPRSAAGRKPSSSASSHRPEKRSTEKRQQGRASRLRPREAR